MGIKPRILPVAALLLCAVARAPSLDAALLAPALRTGAAAPPAPLMPQRLLSRNAAPVLPSPAAAPTLIPAAPAPLPAAPVSALETLRALDAAEAPALAAPAYFDGARPAADAATPAVETAGPDAVAFNGVSLPARAFSRSDDIPRHLIAAIDAAKDSLRLALYDLNIQGLADAIVRAHRRGVDVRLIYDESHGSDNGLAENDPLARPSAQFRQLAAAGVPIKLLRGSGKYGIMHNKIAIFDGLLLKTGSFNWTVTADERNFENAVFRKDASLAALYAEFWDWMWGLAHALDEPPAPSEDDDPRSFGPPPQDPAPSLRFKGRTWPRAVFSPQGGTEARLVSAIDLAEESLDIAIFSLTSREVVDAAVRARARGVAVRVVADAWQAKTSPVLAALVESGVPVRLSAGRGERSVMHHKFALIDGELLADGSFNFTVNAEKNNFENQLYSTDPADIAAFKAEMDFIWKQAHIPSPSELPAETEGGAPAEPQTLDLPPPAEPRWLWHGTRAGEDDAALASIAGQGLRKERDAGEKNMQAPGVYFFSNLKAARRHARFMARKGLGAGAGAVIGVPAPTDPADWDLDYEAGFEQAFRFLKAFKDELADLPADLIRVVVTKANLPWSFPDIRPKERGDMVFDGTLKRVEPTSSGLRLVMHENVWDQAEIIELDWDKNSVQGAKARSNSFAFLLERLCAYCKRLDPDHFRAFLRGLLESGERFGVKYVGDEPLRPGVMQVRRDGGRWKTYKRGAAAARPRARR